MQDLKRRKFLQWGLGSVGGALILKNASAASVCSQTAEQAKGPFYPGENNINPVNDLTRVDGRSRAAQGQVIYVQGIVRDLSCTPIEGVNVDIWQACASGKYNHAGDPNPAPLDPDFRYWGETFSNAAGEYSFKTILPGAYPASDAWDRPPHIHFRIAKLGYKELITQMYFEGEPLNDKDLILRQVPERMRDNVIVDFTTGTGNFDISIEKVV